jgi:hypothetical protein
MKLDWLEKVGIVAAFLCVASIIGAVAQHATGQSSPAPPGVVPPTCTTFKAAGESGVYVNLADDVTPETIAHVREAVRKGEPRILHWKPEEAEANRAASLAGTRRWGLLSEARRQEIDPVNWQLPHDRDEYPPAASDEGGTGADIAYILSTDNSRSGQRMGAVMHPFCPETPFIVEP